MKVVSRFLAAFMIAALVLPLAAIPALAASAATSMSISPTSGPAGTEVEVYGNRSDSISRGYVYYEIDPDRNEWVQVLSNSSGNWEFDEEDVSNTSTPDWRYYYQSAPFEIPESIGGVHRIAIVKTSLGTTTTWSNVNAEKASSNAIKEFTVTPTLTVVSAGGSAVRAGDIADGPAGTEVELKGMGFGYREDIDVYFDGELVDLVATIRANDVGTWTGKFVVPAASKGRHDITAGGDDTRPRDVTAAKFEVIPGISISPTKGAVGSEFTVKGSGFASSERSIEIVFAGKVAKSGITADSDGIFETKVIVPAATMGNQEVGARGQNTTLASVEKRIFEVESKIFVEPLSGNVGTQLEVSGAGLPASTAVTVTYDGVTKGTGTTSSDGTLAAITFAATHTQTTHTSDHPVAVMYGTTTLTETFVMESTAPAKPTPRTPLSGTRIGLLGKQSPTLTWSVVDDPSGVTYGLQISTTPDFSQILISKSGLVAQGSAIIVSSSGPEMSYTLSATEALPFGTYYWRVKAVDGAMNDSGWSASSTFKSGLLPTWALIVIIVLAAVLIGALIYVLIIRDRVGLYD
jgi:hypothetical protein